MTFQKAAENVRDLMYGINERLIQEKAIFKENEKKNFENFNRLLAKVNWYKGEMRRKNSELEKLYAHVALSVEKEEEENLVSFLSVGIRIWWGLRG